MTSLAHPSYPSPAYPARRRGQKRPARRLAPLAVDAQQPKAQPKAQPTPTANPVTLDADAERLAALAAGSGMTALLYADAAATPLLSAEEERTLIARAQAGDASARDHLVRANVRLVGSVCRWYLMRTPGAAERFGIGKDDLMQEGMIGLLKAIEGFDLSTDYRFSTYAVQWIRQTMSRARDNRGFPIRIPSYMLNRIRQIRRLRVTLMTKDGRPPSVAKLARTLDLTPQEIEEALDAAELLTDPLSLDRTILTEHADDPDAQTFAGLLHDPEAELAFTAVETELDVATAPDSVTQIMLMLKARGCVRMRSRSGKAAGTFMRDLAREMEIVERHTLRGESLRSIGADLGISRERVRQIEVGALDLIRKERREIRRRLKEQAQQQAQTTKEQTTTGGPTGGEAA